MPFQRYAGDLHVTDLHRARPSAVEEPITGSQTLDRALTVLLQVAASGERGLSLADCSAILGYTKPTTHRILRTLTRREFLRVDEELGLYTLGITNLRLGARFLDDLDVRREALPELRALAEESGETVHLGTLSDTVIVYIDKVESEQAVRMFSRVGDTMPAHSTGIGKAVLAFLPEDEVDRHLPALLEQRTPHTIVDRDALRAELARIRERGHSTDDVENELGIRCVGAPIFDHLGRVQAGISVAGPEHRMTRERAAALGPCVRRHADTVSERLGHGATLPLDT
jgi:IclR family acetate operon transcriptional repressor